MSLLYAEGFDLTDPAINCAGLADQLTGWSFFFFNSATNQVGRTGTGRSVRLGAFNGTTFSTPVVDTSGSTEGVFGFAFRTPPAFPTSTAAGRLVAPARDGSRVGFILQPSTAGALLINNQNGTLIQDTGVVLQTDRWYYIECKFNLVAAGDIEIKLDGNSVYTGTHNLSGNAGAGWNQLILGSREHTYDDIYICSTSGPFNNDFLGPLQVRVLLPNADGNSNDFTSSGAGDNYTFVDELVSDDDTTYVESATSGDVELYLHEASMPVGNIIGVVQTVSMRATDVNPMNVEFTTRSGGTNINNGVQSVASEADFRHYFQVYDTNPASGGVWTETALDSTEFGLTIE